MSYPGEIITHWKIFEDSLEICRYADNKTKCLLYQAFCAARGKLANVCYLYILNKNKGTRHSSKKHPYHRRNFLKSLYLRQCNKFCSLHKLSNMRTHFPFHVLVSWLPRFIVPTLIGIFHHKLGSKY